MAEEEGRNKVSQLIGLENERTARRAKKQDTPNVAGSREESLGQNECLTTIPTF